MILHMNQARNWQNYQTQPNEEQQKKVVVKIRKKSWLTKGEKIIYAFLCMLIIFSGIYIVSFSGSTDTLNREVQSLEQKVEHQKVEIASSQYEIRELSKPERIIKIAKENGLKIQDTEVKRAKN